jgi:tetraacyldisaccharide 4'-kinase
MPFALIYGSVIIIRNFLYDKKILKSAAFGLPLICVGNLVAGGTGKSPMVEYLLNLLHDKFSTGTLSRGYKRKTSGYVLANDSTTALEIGDEPMLFHQKFPDVAVAVGEERIVAIPDMLHDRPELEAIILDDAFQHRTVRAGMNILLTEHGDLYTDDFFLPTGDLRDQPSSSKRADIIVVTKCPPGLSEDERKSIAGSLHIRKNQHLFFTAIEYGEPYHIIHHEKKRPITLYDEVFLVCGIANPKPLKNYLAENAATYYQQNYSDHHIYLIDDLKEISERFAGIDTRQKFILTTEKDAVRLVKFGSQLENMPFYVLPISHRFLFDGGKAFDKLVVDFVSNFKRSPEESNA